MSLQWPDGVDKKQLPAMFRIWPKEYNKANATTSKEDNTNTKEIIIDNNQPVIEQANQPVILVL